MRGGHMLELEAFLEIAERGSFGGAARRLGLAVSTVSHRIRCLEERLDVRLLSRTTRSVALTEAGQVLFAEIQPALRSLDAATDAVIAYREVAAGRLRLTIAPPAASSIVGPLVARFLEAHPAISMEISVDGARTDIVRDHFDAGIRLGTRVAEDMVAVRLGPPVPAIVAASPQYLARKGRPATPSDLAHHDCLRVRLPNGALLPWRFQQDGEVFDAQVSGPLVVNDRELELRAVLDGLGITHTLSNRLDRLVRRGELVSLLEDWLPPPFEFYLYHPSRRQSPPALKALIEFLRQEARSAVLA